MSDGPIAPDPTPADIESERERVRASARNQVLAVLIGVAMLVVAGVIALVLFGGDDEVITEPTITEPTITEPTITEPTTTEATTTERGDDPVADEYPGLSSDHPLVGRTELDARETYPVVRITWLDGDALMTTMDLVPGRVNLALDDGTVVAAAAEGCNELPPDPPLWMTQACDPSPDAGATVFGRLLQAEGDPTALVLEPGFDADRYYEGLLVAPGDIPTMVDMTGAPINATDLQAGQSVWLWISGPCAESFPVQCNLDALAVER